MSLLRPGDRVLLPSDGYYTSRLLAEKYLAPMGVAVDLCPTRDYDTRDLAGCRLADGPCDRTYRRAHAVDVRRLRHDHHVAAKPPKQVDGRRDAEGPGQHKVGIVVQHVLGATSRYA